MNNIIQEIEGKQGYFQESVTVHDRYSARPISNNPDVEGKLEKMCLAQFATSYTVIAKLPKKAEMDEDGCSKELTSQKIFNSECDWLGTAAFSMRFKHYNGK